MKPTYLVTAGTRAGALSIATALWWGLAVIGAGRAAGGEPSTSPARTRTIVDHAVVPAGGLGCRQCGVGACRPHGGHLTDCRDGLCAPHCPVRPSQYGFYRTQWRRWPGAGVVPASAEQAATPIPPPAVQVPGPDEESPQAFEEGVAPGENGADSPATGDAPVEKPAGDSPDVPPRDSPIENSGKGGPAPKQRADESAPAGPAETPPVPPAPPGEPPLTPAAEDPAAGLLDRSEVPAGGAEVAVEAGSMRYPEQVGRSLATGVGPWRLDATSGQRAAGSARGL